MSRPNVLTAACCWLAGLLFSPATNAQAIGLYEGQALVATQSEEDRVAAAPAALGEVLAKVSGVPAAATNAELAAARADALALMSSHRYQRETIRVAGAAQERYRLIASFNRAGVDRLLSRAGYPQWPTPRPTPVVWLAIDDGRGARFVSASQARVIAAMTDQANRRGISLNLPLVDAQDQQALTPEAVWAQDFPSVARASKRYPGRIALAGKMFRTDNGWRGEWTLLENGEAIGAWDAVSVDAATVLARGADGTADALAKRYSRRILGGKPGRYSIWVEDLRSATDMARALAYLRGLAVVRDADLIASRGSSAKLGVSLTTGLDGFDRFVSDDDVLARRSTESPAPDPADGGTGESPARPETASGHRYVLRR